MSIGSVEYILDNRIKVDPVELAINPRPRLGRMRIGGCAEIRAVHVYNLIGI